MNLSTIGGVLRRLGDRFDPQAGEPRGYVPEQQRKDREREQARRHYRPGEQETDLVNHVKKCYSLAESAKQPYYGVWALCLAFYKGDQYRRWDSESRQLTQAPSETDLEWRERIVDNQITMLVQTAAAKANRSKHITRGLPNDPRDPEDVAAAEVGTKVLRHLDRVTERNQKRRQLEIVRATYGTAFLAPYWDSSLSAEVAFEDPNTQAVRGIEAMIGEANVDLLNPWEVAPQPVSQWRHVSWCVKARWRTLDWIADAYGDRGLVVSPESPNAELFGRRGTVDYRSIFKKVSGQTDGEGGEPGALLLEYYCRKSKRYPRGRYIVVANGVQLWPPPGVDPTEVGLPHPKARFPIVPAVHQFVPDDLWGRGVVEDLLGQQMSLNKFESRIQEAMNLTAWPKLKVAREANLDEDAGSNEPGEVLEYDAQGGIPGPEYLNPPSLPSQVFDLPELIKSRMQGIAGLNQASVGQPPSGVKSGIAIDLLQKQDDTRMSLPAEDAADAWMQTDQQLLEMVQGYYTVPRVIKIIGKSVSDVEVLSFMGTDLRGNTEVALESADGIADDISTKRQRYIDYYEAGMIDQDPETRAELFQAIDETELAEIQQRSAQRQQQQQAAQQQAQDAAAQEQAAQQQAQAAAQMQAQQQQEQLKAQAQAAQLEQQQAIGAAKAQRASDDLAVRRARHEQDLLAMRDKHQLEIAMMAARARQEGSGRNRPAA